MLNNYRKLFFLTTAVLVPEKKTTGFDVCTEKLQERAWW